MVARGQAGVGRTNGELEGQLIALISLPISPSIPVLV